MINAGASNRLKGQLLPDLNFLAGHSKYSFLIELLLLINFRKNTNNIFHTWLWKHNSDLVLYFLARKLEYLFCPEFFCVWRTMLYDHYEKSDFEQEFVKIWLYVFHHRRLFYFRWPENQKRETKKTLQNEDRPVEAQKELEVPADCKGLNDRLTSTSIKAEFLSELQRIETWTYGKCELLHWIDVLDLCDEVLEAAAARPEGKWALAVDGGDDKLKELVLWTLHFTTLLIEHSFSRHLYSSMEHLTTLLASSDLDVVLAVLNLLYMFSKRSNFIARLAAEKRSGLLSRLTHLAAGWGGKDNGFGLSKCCSDDAVR